MVIVVTGAIASGKSTIARELARELERVEVRAAVIDLDLVHDMITPLGSMSDDASWTLARRGLAMLANTFLADGVAVVIADGSFNSPGDRAALARDLGADTDPVYVTLRVSFEEALRRAQSDPSRGISRDPDFLGSYFVAMGALLATVAPTDIVIDTEQMTARSAAAAIAGLVRPDWT